MPLQTQSVYEDKLWGERHGFKGWHWHQEILWIYENNLANWLCGKFKNSSKLVNHNYQVLQVAGRWTMLKICSKMAESNKTGTKQKLSASQTQCQLLHVVWLFLDRPTDDQTGVIIIIITLLLTMDSSRSFIQNFNLSLWLKATATISIFNCKDM